MENAKNNKDEFYHNNSIRGKSKEQFPLSLFSETGAEQYFAAQRHLKTQKQFYGQLNYNKSTTKTSLSYETQTSYQPLAIPPHLDSIPLSINPASFPTTQSVSNSDKSGHNNTSSFSIGDELGELLTMDKDTEKQGAPLNEASSISFQGNNIFFKYQDGNDVESLLNDPHFLNFNLMSSNPQWQSNKLLISSTQPSDHKEQEKQASKENERNESDVFNELVSLAQNHNYMKNPHIPSLDHGEQIARNNEESNFIPENVDHRNSQYSEYYFHGFPNFQCHNNRNFKLEVIQQPARARMCGYGNKDRRPITPPPIVKLIVTSEDGFVIDPESFDTSFMILMCDSCQQESEEYTGVSSEVTSQLVTFSSKKERSVINMRNLVGSSVSSATKLYDLDGNLGIFFIFQDISLRTEGRFKLKLSLIDIESQYSHTVNTTSASEVISTVHTDIFTVYTAKNFPGVVESTPLTQCFSRQGIKIPFRRDIGKMNIQKKDSSQKDVE